MAQSPTPSQSPTSSQRRQGRPSPGDMTGNQTAKLAKQRTTEERERTAEVSMTSQQESYEQSVGIYDPHTQQRIDEPGASEVQEVQEEEAVPFGGGYTSSEPVLSGRETPEQLDQLIAARKSAPVRRTEVAHSAEATVRMDMDVEKMTFGMRNGEPNNYNLKEGFTYRLPHDVAQHVFDLGLVREWVSS